MDLHLHPPTSLRQTHDLLLLLDDFSPIRDRASSEAPIRDPSRRHRDRRSSAVQKDPKRRRSPRSELPQRPRLPNAGLGGRNIFNTREATVRHAQNRDTSPNSPLKRRLASPDDDDHPLKRYCLTSVYEKDVDWIKDELKDIKESLKEISEYFRGDVDLKIEEIIHRLQQMS